MTSEIKNNSATHRCSKCGQSKPLTEHSLVKGKVRGKGVCRTCRSTQRRAAYWRKRANRCNEVLEKDNQDTLAQLRIGSYELIFSPENAPTDGYLMLGQHLAIVVDNGQAAQLDYSISAIAKYLADRNLCRIASKLTPPVAAQ